LRCFVEHLIHQRLNNRRERWGRLRGRHRPIGEKRHPAAALKIPLHAVGKIIAPIKPAIATASAGRAMMSCSACTQADRSAAGSGLVYINADFDHEALVAAATPPRAGARDASDPCGRDKRFLGPLCLRFPDRPAAILPPLRPVHGSGTRSC
jgi:hypothetical protein